MIARNRAAAPEPQEAVEPTGQEKDPADLVQAGDDAERIARAMAKLPESQLEVIRLAYFDGLSHGRSQSG